MERGSIQPWLRPVPPRIPEPDGGRLFTGPLSAHAGTTVIAAQWIATRVARPRRRQRNSRPSVASKFLASDSFEQHIQANPDEPEFALVRQLWVENARRPIRPTSDPAF